jgi:hypothetical protein
MSILKELATSGGDFLLFKKNRVAKTEGMRKTTMAAMALTVLFASCAKEQAGIQEKPIEQAGPPVAEPVEQTPAEAPKEVDLGEQLREPNLLDRLEEGVDQEKKNASTAPAVGPRPVVIRGGETSSAVEPPAPPLTKPKLPDLPETAPQR